MSKKKSDYMIGCLRSEVYKEILKTLFEHEGQRPKDVFKKVSNRIKASLEYVSVYMNRLFKYGVLQKYKPNAAKLAVFYSIEKDTQDFLAAFFTYQKNSIS